MRGVCVAVAMMASQLAHAAPIQLQHQARVLDGQGAPLNGPVLLSVGIYADGSVGTAEWSEVISTTSSDGYVSLILGADPVGNPLDDSVFDGSPRYVGLSLGGTALGPRQLIATVPSAVHATNLSGGAVAATSASVQTQLTLGTDSATCADGSRGGSLRWNVTDRALELCDGVEWRSISTNAPGSCAAIKQQNPTLSSGVYTVAPGGGTPLEVWCDMSGAIGRSLLMRIEGNTSQHVANNGRTGGYPCQPTGATCKLSTEEISRFISEPGTQVFEVDPDASGYLSFFQRAATDTQLWPTNLEGSNRGALLASGAWSWILTSYTSYANALNGTGGDTGDYASGNHYYPTPYEDQQFFFRGNATGLRANTNWGPTGYSDNLSGTLWVY